MYDGKPIDLVVGPPTISFLRCSASYSEQIKHDTGELCSIGYGWWFSSLSRRTIQHGRHSPVGGLGHIRRIDNDLVMKSNFNIVSNGKLEI